MPDGPLDPMLNKLQILRLVRAFAAVSCKQSNSYANIETAILATNTIKTDIPDAAVSCG
jgi:hypothetical protein